MDDGEDNDKDATKIFVSEIDNVGNLRDKLMEIDNVRNLGAQTGWRSSVPISLFTDLKLHCFSDFFWVVINSWRRCAWIRTEIG